LNLNSLINSFSEDRLTPYLNRFDGNELKAIELYKINIKLSESCYVSLSVLEIALRNAIHTKCSNEFWLQTNLEDSLSKQVKDAEGKILTSHKEITSGRLISELTFGFWTSLFNRKYANLLWKPLHRVFHRIPTEQRQRAFISPKLNSIRTFRNRIYHYEPIFWDLDELEKHYLTIYEVIDWLNPELSKWTNDIDNFEAELEKARNILRE
jgi:hypothetical protein